MRNPLIMLLFALSLCAEDQSAAASPTQSPVTWISSTAGEPWKIITAPVLEPDQPDVPAQVRIDPGRTYQTIDGFGGCFNELGWIALGKASAADRHKALSALFGDDGCAFTLARLPIGSSDFALDAYSLDDTAGDFELKDFSIQRDRKHLIPFVKAAMAVRPKLQCWGSPWSPPAWMKDNNHYSKGSLKWESAVLQAYAKYFVRWLEAYRAEGIDIYALTPQNEPNIASPYPTCLWTGPQLREFIADYLGPTLRERKANVEVWLGLNGDPPNNGHEQCADVRALEQDWKFRRVLSCVDKNAPRHSIQNVWPELIIGGSTFECGVLVQVYDLRSGGECLKCSNPIELDQRTIEGETDRWKKMTPSERRQIAEQKGLNLQAIETHLDQPECGQLGQQEIAKFVLDPRRDWSVGFVSVAAGVLLAAKTVQSEIAGLDAAFPVLRGQALRFSFLNPGPAISRHQRSEKCNCREKGKSSHQRLWGS